MIDRLAASLGREPESAWRAPGRVNLIGEHTDYNGGFVLPFAIDRSTVAAGTRRDDGELTFASLGREEDSWLAYPRGVARVLRDAGVELPGADVVIASDVPEGSGLSSSAALEVAVALVLCELAGVEVDPVELALLCRRAEEEAVGVPVGVMDQLISLLGQRGHALLIDTRSLETEQIPLPLHEAGVTVLVIDTAVAHSLRASGYADRRQEAEEVARALGAGSLREISIDDLSSLSGTDLKRARHVVEENERVLGVAELLRRGRIEEVGPFLTASHESLRDDYEVSTPELDTAVERATAAGALGARMVGGGFGGSAIALCRTAELPAVEDAVRRGFEASGFAGPRFAAVTPSDGASKVA